MLHLLYNIPLEKEVFYFDKYNIPLEKEVFYFDKKQEKSFGTIKAKK